MADSKKAHFSKSPILKIFSRKFLRLVLGLVGLNDAKGIDVAQRIWPWGCPTKAQKQPKSTENAFFGCFWAFVRQPHGHIHWATSMPFASFNPKAILIFFSKKKNCFIPMKTSQSLLVSKDGSKFWSSQRWQHFLTQTKHFDRERTKKVARVNKITSMQKILSNGVG